jgi:trigger factor
LLDAIASAEKVEVTDAELSEYLMRSAMRYGMSPDEFTQQLVQSGNLTAVFSEVARAKAMATILERVQVKDASGKAVDLAALRPKPALED